MGATVRFELFGDLDGMVEFYTRVLGFSLLREDRAHDYVYLGRDAVRIGLLPPAALGGADPSAHALRRPPNGVEIVLEVDDVRGEFARVRASGWPVDAPLTERPWGLTDFRLLDPSGYYLRVTDRSGGP